MTNALAVCLLSISFFCCTSLSTARHTPKECSKGPEYWCKSLKSASDCGAVQHCIGTVWEQQQVEINQHNDVSNMIVHLFRKLKDVKDLINEDYLATRVKSACSDIRSPPITAMCKENTASLDSYLMHVLQSNTSAETMCKIIGMCNNAKLDNLVNKKKVEESSKQKPKLLGSAKCTWGPSYWCSNFSTGRECGATHHCVQRVWSRMTFPEDNDGICKICKDMVGQARDQLQSNETQEELKEVFEGECKLIPIKIVTKECIKLADDFVPELVETLASEMNPDAVCSVAGLCNNANIDKLLDDYNAALKRREGCSNCRRSVGIARKRFDETSYENFLVGLLQVCQNMGSLSDSCSMLTFKYYENILEAVRKDFTPQSVCHLSGQCSHLFHSHNLYTFPDELKDLKASDDVPCEFCEQVIKHLRDTLIANTSEVEFHKVLIGLCKHTGNFKTECLQLVEKYDSTIYNYLVSDLKPDMICGFIGICTNKTDVTIAPLLPKELVDKYMTMSSKLIGQDEANSYTTPKEASCPLCLFAMQELDTRISDNRSEENIEKVLDDLCNHLPTKLRTECVDFVKMYRTQIIDMVIAEFTPQEVCVYLRLCDAINNHVDPLAITHHSIDDYHRNPALRADRNNKKRPMLPVEMLENGAGDIKTTETPVLPIERMFIATPSANAWCSFCQYFLHYLQVELSDDNNEEVIKKTVEEACDVLPQSIDGECRQFVTQYGPAVIALLVQEIDPASVCPALGLCPSAGEVRRVSVHSEKSNCPLCLFAVEQLETVLKNNRSEESIRKALDGLCNHLSTKLRPECVNFVDTYSNQLVEMLVANLNAQEICVYLKLCKDDKKHVDPLAITHHSIDDYHRNPALRADRNNKKRPMLPAEMLENGAGDINTNEIPDNTLNGRPIKEYSQSTVCVICEFVLKEIDDQIKDKHNDDEIKKVVHSVCKRMPKSVRSECDQFVEKYADLVISLLAQELDPDEVCRELKLCEAAAFDKLREEILDCAVCETVVMAVKKVLSNDKVDRNIVHVVEKACSALPAKYNARCHTMMEIYGEGVIHLIEEFGTKDVCKKIGLCSAGGAAVRMHRDD